MTRREYITAVRAKVGKPFTHGGRGPASFDCCGLLIAGARECGVSVIDAPAGYSRLADGQMMGLLRRNGIEVNLTDAKPGDIAVFWFDRGTREPQHAGLFNESMGLIHAYMHVGKVVEHGMDRFFSKRLCHVLRMNGLED